MLFLSGHAENAEMGESREFLYPSVTVWSPSRKMSNYCIFNLLSNDCVCCFTLVASLLQPELLAREKTTDNPQTWNFQNYPEPVLREQQKVQILIGSDLFCPTVCISLLPAADKGWSSLASSSGTAQNQHMEPGSLLIPPKPDPSQLSLPCEVPRERWAPCTAHGNEESGSPKICNWCPKARADN